MFGKGLFQRDIEPRCAYCAKGAAAGEDGVLCAKRGLVSPEDSCRSFRYDPLKRVPPKPVQLDLSGLDEEDFKL